jgi:hypothetical protein
VSACSSHSWFWDFTLDRAENDDLTYLRTIKKRWQDHNSTQSELHVAILRNRMIGNVSSDTRIYITGNESLGTKPTTTEEIEKSFFVPLTNYLQNIKNAEIQAKENKMNVSPFKASIPPNNSNNSSLNSQPRHRFPSRGNWSSSPQRGNSNRPRRNVNITQAQHKGAR